uniref:G_PROTEIN_RECEP_F1_2 domain-containing protein n=1 Tax=Steinernema glaseri TaxID=37863 RepID=A0A1I8AJL6_9BILA
MEGEPQLKCLSSTPKTCSPDLKPRGEGKLAEMRALDFLVLEAWLPRSEALSTPFGLGNDDGGALRPPQRLLLLPDVPPGEPSDPPASVARLQGAEEKFLFIWVYPVLLLLSVFGNTMNVVLYHHPFLRSSSTVKLLLFRSKANLLFSLSLLPNFLYALSGFRRSPHLPYTVLDSDSLELFYWRTVKYMLFFSNVLNTASVWLTVCVTAHLLALVVWPLHAKDWLTMWRVHWLIFGVGVFSFGLHAIVVFFRDVTVSACPAAPEILVHHYLSLSWPVFDRVYYYLSACFVNILPLLILLVCCLWIGHSSMKRGKSSILVSTLTKKANGRHRCVLNLAAATTVCHLVFEFPSSAVQFLAAVSSAIDTNWRFQAIIAASNFLTILHASITFLLYTATSAKYRELALSLCGLRASYAPVPGSGQPLTTPKPRSQLVAPQDSDVQL